MPVRGDNERDETEVLPGIREFVNNHMIDLFAILNDLEKAGLTIIYVLFSSLYYYWSNM